ncbi:MAG: CAP domain-containing protein [Candidatus Paceibacterota bacterium]
MNKGLKYLGLVVLIIVLIFVFFVNKTEAALSDFQPIIFIQRTTNLITQRVSDIVYYLVMQKRYIFDNYADPNVYPTWQVADNFDEALRAVNSTSSTTNPVVIFGEPIVVTTSTVPTIRPVTISDGQDSEILRLTNIEREKKSLNPLLSNSMLDRVADLRLDDLFDNQYFAHESPDNKSVSDLARKNNYSYSLIGENLALGNYDSDEEIVEAWMASTGHRANILNSKYEELGVAKREGLFNDQMSTIAVQVFADPLAQCQRPSAGMKSLIDSSSQSIKDMQAQAKPMYDNLIVLKNTPGLDRAYYNQKIQEYNYFAKKINDAVSALKVLVDHYNSGVSEYNTCLKS